MLNNNHRHMSQHALAYYIKVLWHTVTHKLAISGGVRSRHLWRTSTRHQQVPSCTHSHEKQPETERQTLSAAVGHKVGRQLTLHCSKTQQSGPALITHWYYSNKVRRWHFREWHFCRLTPLRANKKCAMLKVGRRKKKKKQKAHRCPHWPFCPLCQW